MLGVAVVGADVVVVVVAAAVGAAVVVVLGMEYVVEVVEMEYVVEVVVVVLPVESWNSVSANSYRLVVFLVRTSLTLVVDIFDCVLADCR